MAYEKESNSRFDTMWPFKKTIKNYPTSLLSRCAGELEFRDEMNNYQIPGTDEAVEIRSFGYHGRWEEKDVFFVPPEKGNVDIEGWAAQLDEKLDHIQQNLGNLLEEAGDQVDSLRHEGEFMGEFKAVETQDVREFIEVKRVRVMTGEGSFLLCSVFVCEGRTIEVEVAFNMAFDFLRAEIIGGGYLF